MRMSHIRLSAWLVRKASKAEAAFFELQERHYDEVANKMNDLLLSETEKNNSSRAASAPETIRVQDGKEKNQQLENDKNSSPRHDEVARTFCTGGAEPQALQRTATAYSDATSDPASDPYVAADVDNGSSAAVTAEGGQRTVPFKRDSTV